MRLLPVVGLVLGLAACSDPLAGVDRLSEVDVVATDPAAAALPDAEEVARDGFLGTSAAQGEVPEGVPAPAVQAEAPKAGGFLRGLINRAANADPAAAIAADVAARQSEQVIIETTAVTTTGSASDAIPVDEPVELAALTPENVTPREELKPRRSGFGLFGGGASKPKKNAARTGPDTRDVEFGTTLAFGEIARVCDAKGKALGKKVASLGRRGFALHDSNPGVRDKRTFYITGFGDSCPRQFTAANALFGTPSFYETIRFSPAGKHLPYAATDTAYDKVKSKVCRAKKNKPCGGKINTLDAELAFVSAYEFGEINNKWKEFLIYDGTVLASALKSY
ncbi:hypothetical protein [uncultured Sulfitobacter sp.]|uniref:hypothetical protein n=1 Tax=uncultured Sulfitobacter sp. TaxID=191468 RepID=UPI002610744D|nr:hypothetical protein [uncultured Sulfitobacter sp.]